MLLPVFVPEWPEADEDGGSLSGEARMPIYVAKFYRGEFTNDFPRAFESIEADDFGQALEVAARRTIKGDRRVVVEELSNISASRDVAQALATTRSRKSSSA